MAKCNRANSSGGQSAIDSRLDFPANNTLLKLFSDKKIKKERI